MAKLRIGFKNIEIVMNKIISVTIDSKVYNKKDYIDSQEIFKFYVFIKHNKKLITYITYRSKGIEENYEICHLYLKFEQLHNLNGYAYYIEYKNNILGEYYINGKRLTYENWEKGRTIELRSEKLRQINLS